MRERLLELIACPVCRGTLTLSGGRMSGGVIDEGRLICDGCGAGYPVTRGIPRLVPRMSDARTAESFGFEWTTVDVTDPEEDVVTFFRKTGLDPRIYQRLPAKERYYATTRDLSFTPDGSSLRGKLVLDAGCGMGRYLNVAKAYGCELVGMDFSRSVERAAAMASSCPTMHIVQGDLMAPPFRPGTFNFIYSIGVLHHTPDPPASFESLAPLCRPGGELVVYVYPPSFWLDPVRGAVLRALRAVTVRLPHRVLLRLCERLAAPLGSLQMRLAERPVAKFLGAPLFLVTVPRHRKRGVMIGDTFDTYSARYIRTYTEEDVRRWFRSAGFDSIEALPYPTTVRGRRARHGAAPAR
jgi:SAM-dependent methyltransferase